MDGRGRTRLLLALTVSVPVLLACDGGPRLLEPESCPNEQVAVSVSTDSYVDFNWSPACPVAWLEVFHTDSVVAVWIVSGRSENTIQPVARYGLLPAGALEVLSARALVPGVSYDIRVYRWIGDLGGPGSIFQAGHTEFVR